AMTPNFPLQGNSMMDRRKFLRVSALFTAATASPLFVATKTLAASAPKRVLVFGGRSFLGPAVVDALLVDGHTVTLFNRGVTGAELFPKVEKLKGFRSADPKDQDLSAL